MAWQIEFLDEAREDLRKLDGSVRARVLKAIAKTSTNPLPQSEGGYGKPLGHRVAIDLVGFLKIKLKSDGIRVVYRLEQVDDKLVIVVVGVRTDLEVYREAVRRRKARDL